MSDKSANVPMNSVQLAKDGKTVEVFVRGFPMQRFVPTEAFRTAAMLNGINQAVTDAGALPSGSTIEQRLAARNEKVTHWVATGEWTKKADPAAIRAEAERKAGETAKAKLIESIRAMQLSDEQKEMMIAAVG
jgi:hypothetical protein